jgi:hypothetical protein
MNNQLSDREFFVTTEALNRYGGNFFRNLGRALRHADQGNRNRLLEAFPEIVKSYGPGTAFYSSCIAEFNNEEPAND